MTKKFKAIQNVIELKKQKETTASFEETKAGQKGNNNRLRNSSKAFREEQTRQNPGKSEHTTDSFY